MNPSTISRWSMRRWSRPPRLRLSDAALDLDRVFGAPEASRRRRTPSIGPPRRAAALRPADSRRRAAHHQGLAAAASRWPSAAPRRTPQCAPSRRCAPPTLDLASDLDEVGAATATAEPPPSIRPAATVVGKRHRRYEAAVPASPAPDAAVGARLLAVIIDLIDPRRHRRRRRLLHDADLRHRRRGRRPFFPKDRCSRSCSCRTAATWWRSRPAGRRSARWPPASASCPRSPSRAARSRPRVSADADVGACSPIPAGLGFLTALFSRDHRGLHDRFAGTRVVRASGCMTMRPERLAIAVATVGGIGYVPFAPGTFGSAAGVLVWWLLGPSAIVQASRSLAIFCGRRVERRRRRTARAAAPIPAMSSSTKSMGMLITLFLDPVGWARRARRRSCSSALADVVKPYPANRFERLPRRPRRHGGRLHGRRLRQSARAQRDTRIG